MTFKGTLVEERALALLGSGLGPQVVSDAIGISISRISQLLAQEEFAQQVAQLRFDALQAHNIRDTKLDSLEDALIKKLEDVLPMMFKPMEIVRALSTINAAKRRGTSAPEQITAQQTIVNITLPTTIVHRFTADINNQAVEVSSSNNIPLITAQLTQVDNMATEVLKNVRSKNLIDI